MIISQDKNLEIFENVSEGYERTMNYESWRVAIANYAERFDKNKYDKVERHLLTDEVFVLLEGNAELAIGDIVNDSMQIKYITLDKGKIYNVKKCAWHNILMSVDAKVLIVENHNTAIENTEYYYVKGEQNHE